MESVNFKSFNLKEPVLRALKDMGFDGPTEVQKKVIPVANEGKDLIVLSKTGSGKTASFGIPIINEIIDNLNGKAKALILTPTRELALQVCGDLKQIAAHSDIKTTCVYGQHNMNTEVNELDEGADLIFGTPGRTLDHLRSGTMDLSEIKYFVLDEADRMLTMGFIEQVEAIIKFLPKDRQTLLLSATMPFEIMNICWQYMNSPIEVKLESETKTVERVKQVYYRVEANRKREGLYKVICLYRPESLIIFCNTRWQVDRLKSFLEEKGFSVKGIHGGVSQKGRTNTMESFKRGVNDILVATDVAARGIHVDDLEMVINYDVPVEKDNYVHRIGRTGRIGNSGIAVTLACSEDMYSLYEIEEHIGSMISEVEFPADDKMQEAYHLAKEFYKLKGSGSKSGEGKPKRFKKPASKPAKAKAAGTKRKTFKKPFKTKKKAEESKNVVFVFNNGEKEVQAPKAPVKKRKASEGSAPKKPFVKKKPDTSTVTVANAPVEAKEPEKPAKLSFFKRLFGRKK